MRKYLYTAKTEDGKTVRGREFAADEQDLYLRLKEKGLYLLSARPAEKNRHVRRFRTKILAEFARELGTLLHAGVPLIRALTIIAQEEDVKPAQKKVYDEILNLLRQGSSFSDALEAQGSAFPELMVRMMRTAEAGGNLDEVSMRLANHYEKEYRLTNKVKSAMTYPLILCVIVVLVVIIIFSYVIPQFARLFANMEDLPFATRLILGISDVLRHHWPMLLLLLLLAAAVLRALLGTSPVKYALDRMKTRIPVVGGMLKTVYTARFARTLSSLYASGLPIVTALQIGKRTIGNVYIERQFDEAVTRILEGESLSQALGSIDGFVHKFSSTVMVGEETGRLDQMLLNMADMLDFEAERAIERLVTLLEPLMIVCMAVIVGFIIISVIQPIYGSYDTLGAGL